MRPRAPVFPSCMISQQWDEQFFSVTCILTWCGVLGCFAKRQLLKDNEASQSYTRRLIFLSQIILFSLWVDFCYGDERMTSIVHFICHLDKYSVTGSWLWLAYMKIVFNCLNLITIQHNLCSSWNFIPSMFQFIRSCLFSLSPCHIYYSSNTTPICQLLRDPGVRHLHT